VGKVLTFCKAEYLSSRGSSSRISTETRISSRKFAV